MVSPLNKEGLIQGMIFEASDNIVVWFSVFLWFLPVRLELSGSDRFTSENAIGQDVIGTCFILKPAGVCMALQTPVSAEEALLLCMSAVKYSKVLTALKLFCLN